MQALIIFPESAAVKKMMTDTLDMMEVQDRASWKLYRGLIQLCVLLLLWVWAFWPHIIRVVRISLRSSEVAHLLVVPIGVFLLIFLRRKDFAAPSKGSLWGIVLLLLGLFVYSISIWPFLFIYAQEMATILVLAGLILSTCGWRYLIQSIPILLFVMSAIPLGSGIFTRLVILPETYTIAACAKTLELLPGVQIAVKGIDIHYIYGEFSGIIGLGESYRGARLFQPLITLGIFVVFFESRSIWRLLFISMCVIPILLMCNYLRLLCWSLVAVYGKSGIISTWPRFISSTIYLLIAYGLWVLVCNIKFNLFVETDEEESAHEV